MFSPSANVASYVVNGAGIIIQLFNATAESALIPAEIVAQVVIGINLVLQVYFGTTPGNQISLCVSKGVGGYADPLLFNKRSMKAILYKDADRKWRFRFVAKNNKIVAQSEGYTCRVDCLETVRAIRKAKIGVLRNGMILDSVLNIGAKIPDRVIPDKAEREKAQAELVKMQLNGELQQLVGSWKSTDRGRISLCSLLAGGLSSVNGLWRCTCLSIRAAPCNHMGRLRLGYTVAEMPGLDDNPGNSCSGCLDLVAGGRMKD